MTFPAYGKTLLTWRAQAQQGRRELPWVVVVALGALGDREVLRGQKGVARLGCPEVERVARCEWRLLCGLDVLVAFFGEHWSDARREAALVRLWSAGQVATLWQVSQGGAVRIVADQAPSGRWVVFAADGTAPRPLDRTFATSVAEARRHALHVGEGIFARAEFERAREHSIADLLRGARRSAFDATQAVAGHG